MSDLFDLPSDQPDGLPPIDPRQLSRNADARQLPKRFYSAADHAAEDGGFVVRVDGRGVRTPAKAPLKVDREAVAVAMAAEWNAQGEFVNPATMPLTRLVNSAIDGVSREMDAVRAEIVRYAGTDLLCYRADGP